MDHTTDPAPLKTWVGATKVGSRDFSDDPLPMVVYLRGDEPNFSDFAIDADEAMDLLHIKRSRLTQISGRELRVGRVRIDKYTRPVYRAEDIEDYKNRTRPAMSQKKNAEAWKEASAELLEHFRVLLKDIPASQPTSPPAQPPRREDSSILTQLGKVLRWLESMKKEVLAAKAQFEPLRQELKLPLETLLELAGELDQQLKSLYVRGEIERDERRAFYPLIEQILDQTKPPPPRLPQRTYSVLNRRRNARFR